MTAEDRLHKAVAQYISAQYPDWIFNTDLSGIKLPIGLAIKASKLRSSRAFPDIVIYEPRGYYNALFLELKSESSTVFKKNGELYSDEHLKEQDEMIKNLRSRGYYATFAIGFDAAKKIIDSYAELPVITEKTELIMTKDVNVIIERIRGSMGKIDELLGIIDNEAKKSKKLK